MRKPTTPNGNRPTLPKNLNGLDENNKKNRKSAFRSVSPIIRQNKTHNRGKISIPRHIPERGTIGQNFSLTVGVVLVILAVFTLVIAPPAFNLLNKYEARNKAQYRLMQARAENRHLKDQVELWKQPDYVKQEARERLGYVEPGETRFKVVDPGPEYHPRVDVFLEKVPPRPWFLVIANSTKLAGDEHPNQPQEGIRTDKTTKIAPGADQDPPKPKPLPKRH